MKMCHYHLIAPKLLCIAICSLTIGVSTFAAQPVAQLDAQPVAQLDAQPVAQAVVPPTGVLRLNSGDYVTGSLSETNGAAELAWQHPQFESPFLYKTGDVLGAFFPAPKDTPLAKGDFGIELWGGDLLFGSITSADNQTVRVTSAQLGEIEVARDGVRRVYRWNHGDGVTVIDCGSLDGWVSGENEWTEIGGQLRSSKADATLFRDVTIPAKARINVELTWENQPNFTAAFGVDLKEPATAANSAFRIEVWDKQLVAVWEHEDVADLAVLGSTAEFNQELRLTIDLDQEASEATVISDQGKVLAKIALKRSGEKPVAPGFWLENISGIVNLNRLQVTRGDLALADVGTKDVDYLYLKDEQVIAGKWIGVENNEWVFREGETERRVPAAEMLQVDVASSEPGNEASGDDSVLAQLRTIDGIRLTGKLESITEGKINFRPSALSSSITVPAGNVGRLSIMGAKSSPPHRLAAGVARLETADSRLHVQLSDVPLGDSPITLGLEPLGASSAMVRPTLSGRLVYQDPKPKVNTSATAQQAQMIQRQRPAGIWGVFAGAFSTSVQPQATGRKAMYLRSGEVIPCDVKAIDEEVITFKSTMTAQTQVPRDQVRALQLVPGRGEPVLDQLKRERLLTVPRMRKNSPPTHLIVATNGDVMRCRLVGLTSTQVEVETRLETIAIDRKLVAQILWLDAATAEPEREEDAIDEAANAKQSSEFLVRAVLRDGNLISVVPQGVAGNVITGVNELLGECRIDTKEVRELLLGDAESAQIEDKPYGDWRLADAPEPIIPEASDGERSPGLGSALVGKEAPDFTLELLGGGSFKLSEQRGKVVVLDFWATWCGPCMQAMPVIEETVKSFERDDVMLVTVNLQETEEPIRATLERLKLEPQVALDIDGVAAGRYQADAIPQTVVIDQEGKVSRLFVGGGAKLGTQLSEAIEQLIAPEPKTQ